MINTNQCSDLLKMGYMIKNVIAVKHDYTSNYDIYGSIKSIKKKWYSSWKEKKMESARGGVRTHDGRVACCIDLL